MYLSCLGDLALSAAIGRLCSCTGDLDADRCLVCFAEPDNDFLTGDLEFDLNRCLDCLADPDNDLLNGDMEFDLDPDLGLICFAEPDSDRLNGDLDFDPDLVCLEEPNFLTGDFEHDLDRCLVCFLAESESDLLIGDLDFDLDFLLGDLASSCLLACNRAAITSADVFPDPQAVLASLALFGSGL